MKTTFYKSLLSVIIALAVSLFMISCEEDGDATSDSYMKIGSKTYELNHGTFMLSTVDWGADVVQCWHEVALYSNGLSILDNQWGGDSIAGDGSFMIFSVHPTDSTTIVGEYTFKYDWVWDGTRASHGMPAVVTPDTTIYFGEMKEGTTCSISMEGDIYTIAIDGYTLEWVQQDEEWTEDSTAFELHYSGTLVEEEMEDDQW